ncbi:MAG: ATP-binding protein [Alphaproteobacteria bacterium]|nr:ATP-binding protein [Alphaproteobacteria bacterium]
MPATLYTPFDKEISEINASDLLALRVVPEGWYIEYKSSIPNTKSIAKSISAFANTYGGWLFYGIKEAANKDRTAELFPGIPSDDIATEEMKIRQAISACVSPPPYFEMHIVRGPNIEIGLDERRAIIVIRVQKSYTAPHIHSDGRIYRRIADESNPRPETDRHILDMLWKRGKRRQRSLDSLIRTKPEISKAEKQTTYLDVFILPSPWREVFPKREIKFDEFADLMANKEVGSGGLPFDSAQSSSEGFIARQVKDNQADRLSLTWRYMVDGTSHITLPLSSISIDDNFYNANSNTRKFFEGYTHPSDFFSLLKEKNFSSGFLVDLNILFAALWGVMRRHEKLAEVTGLDFPYDLSLRISGTWRRVPFIDTEAYRNFTKQHGIPLVQTSESISPAGDWFYSLSGKEVGQDNDVWTGVKTCTIFFWIAEMFGVPYSHIVTRHSGNEHWYDELNSLLQRAKEVQSRRNRRLS